METKRNFESPFVLNPSKVTKLVEVILDRLRLLKKAESTLSLQITMAGGRSATVSSVEGLFKIDNTRRNKVLSLMIHASAFDTVAQSVRAPSSINVSFGELTAVSIHVRSEETDWSNSTQETIEEQVERCFQGRMARISRSLKENFVLILLPIVLVLTTAVGLPWIASIESDRNEIANSMWLGNAASQFLVESSSGEIGLVPDAERKILLFQLRQLANRPSSDSGVMGFLLNWRVYAVGLPLAFLLCTGGYLLLACYPSAVFAWGDQEEEFARLVQHRDFVSQTLLWGAVIEGLAMLASFGFAQIV